MSSWRADPLTLSLLAVGAGLLVVTALVVSAPATPRDWTIPAVTTAAVPSLPDEDGLGPISLDGVEQVAASADRLPSADPEWVAQVSTSTGIPPVALAAYARATLALQDERPSCRLGWTTLAAIGSIESGHGTHGGAVLGADGRPSVPIIGPALDGYGVAAIPATPESTAWHGDLVWDHAVGPMQFLPSSWARWAADGDGDGSADPHDIDDAAVAAGRYLCADGSDLSTAQGWRDAVLSYNHSEDYLDSVLALADAYVAPSGH